MSAPASPPSSASAPVVYVAAVDDIIHPISAEFMIDAIDTADTHGAAALIFTLETPGGLVDSTRTIVSRIISARTPIIVFVGPGGARAASAGFLITLAADVAVMAPGAHIGAAHPVTGSGEQVGETMQEKMESDVAAYARALAEGRKRNIQLADEAVRKSRAFTADEALQVSPPLIDFISPDVDALIRTLDGRDVRRFDGRTITLHTASARTEKLEMSHRQRFLSTIAHPQVAYVLFSLGLLGLTVELWNPGSILPGVAGGLCLLLAFLAFQVLPINTTGLLLIAFGLLLLVLELKVPSYGVLGSGGTLSLVLGAVIMMDRSSDLRIGLAVAIPPMLTLAAIFLFLGRLALTAQRQPATTGANSLIGRHARALDAMSPHGRGHVAIHGELWTAIATAPITAGTDVRIVDRQGLTLTVEPATPAPPTTAGPTAEGESSS
jgi:membrane-bound serine protease (ClpP class)